MRKILCSLFIVSLLALPGAMSAQGFGDLVNQAKQLNGSNKSGAGNPFNNVSNTDATSALREALQVGTKNAAGKLSVQNGYFGNSLIKIPMPPEASKVEKTMRGMGMGSQVDQAVLAMNRAAEDAATKAVPIFIDAITHMSIQDGLSILRGGNDAATQYLKTKTNAALTIAFTPVIKEALGKVDATKYWSDIFNTYNQLPMVKKVNPDLIAYVTERALNGLFVTVAQEEAKIRTDPAAQVTDLLKKVFGSH
jgi:hypothetical protein